MKYKMTIAYDGTMYSGWQIQPNAVTIQEVIENALKVVLPTPSNVWASGRTDAGVHAEGQVAHFKTSIDLDLRKFRRSMNGLLPPDIRIMSVEPVDSEFHAQFSAKSKVYHYHITLKGCHSPFTRLYSYLIHTGFDMDRLKRAISHFLGEHDFTTFANSATEGSAAKNPVRTIYRIDIVPEPHGFRLEFEGNGFLYKMVRNITGVLVECARGKRDPDSIPALLEARDRRKIGIAAPARGLFLAEVKYEQAAHPEGSQNPAGK